MGAGLKGEEGKQETERHAQGADPATQAEHKHSRAEKAAPEYKPRQGFDVTAFHSTHEDLPLSL
jgi:hypothetical protein